MQRCPNCRARYRGGDECGRCGMMLTSLLRLEEQVMMLERQAVQQLAAGDIEAAQHSLCLAKDKMDSPFLDALQGFITRVQRQSDEAAPP